MRSAEIISIAFFAVFLIAAAVVPLATEERLKALGIGAAGILIAWLLPELDGLPGGRVFRDFVPGFLLLMGYWQTGQFVVGSNAKFQDVLEGFDQRWVPGAASFRRSLKERPGLSFYLETAYLVCYPIVPLGVGVLYLTGQSGAVDLFWRVVLPPTMACYALTTVFQSWPPWMKPTAASEATEDSNLRSANQWVTDHASIRANTFPSSHVTSSVAIGLVLLTVVPVAGGVFLWIAASISIATVLLQYHYALDVVLGVALAVLSFVVLG
jgi:PAP2 superfamily protein